VAPTSGVAAGGCTTEFRLIVTLSMTWVGDTLASTPRICSEVGPPCVVGAVTFTARWDQVAKRNDENGAAELYAGSFSELPPEDVPDAPAGAPAAVPGVTVPLTYQTSRNGDVVVLKLWLPLLPSAETLPSPLVKLAEGSPELLPYHVV
jgi:hypothetical protein